MPDRRGAGLRDAEQWLAWIRLGAVPFAVFQVALSSHYPPHYELAAWLATAAFGVGAITLFLFTRAHTVGPRLALTALVFDTAVVTTYVLIYNFERGTPIRQLILLPISEGALLYGIRGSVALALVSAPIIAAFEWLRARHNTPRHYQVNFVTFQPD